MSNFKKDIQDRARECKGRLVLPEGKDERVGKAARRLVDQGIASEVILLDSPGNRSQEGLTTRNCKDDPDRDEMAHRIASRSSEMTLREAEEMLADPLFYGVGLILVGQAEGLVAGVENPTANVLRAALKTLGTREDSSLVSSSFVMEVQDRSYGENGRLLFTDPAVIPSPNPQQLADMAGDAVRLYRNLIGEGEPRVAFLSFSTRGSAEHGKVEQMRQSYQNFVERHPDIMADGELQADAALVPEVAKRKAPDSDLAGRANILVFPDLNAANIGYKLVERLGNAGAYGPFLQGLNGAVNDLSRGCSVDDIVTVAAATLVQGSER